MPKQFSYKHKPTKLWVRFNKTTVELTPTQKDATQSPNPYELKKALLNAQFQNSKNYGKENFLEFELTNS
jgi:hypothetical protein